MSPNDKVDAVTSSSSSVELDPLLKDLTERKLSFKKNVVTLAAELKDAQRRLALQEQSYAIESRTRKVSLIVILKGETVLSWVVYGREQNAVSLTGSRDEGNEHGGRSRSVTDVFTGEGWQTEGIYAR